MFKLLTKEGDIAQNIAILHFNSIPFFISLYVEDIE